MLAPGLRPLGLGIASYLCHRSGSGWDACSQLAGTTAHPRTGCRVRGSSSLEAAGRPALVPQAGPGGPCRPLHRCLRAGCACGRDRSLSGALAALRRPAGEPTACGASDSGGKGERAGALRLLLRLRRAQSSFCSAFGSSLANHRCQSWSRSSAPLLALLELAGPGCSP